MIICRTIGTAVSTVKHPALEGYKLLVVQAATLEGQPQGEPFVAIDLAGAGEAELVLVTRGSAASPEERHGRAPVDAAIVAILDSLAAAGKVVFRKGRD